MNFTFMMSCPLNRGDGLQVSIPPRVGHGLHAIVFFPSNIDADLRPTPAHVSTRTTILSGDEVKFLKFEGAVTSTVVTAAQLFTFIEIEEQSVRV